MEGDQPVLCSRRCCPMHPRDCPSEENCGDGSLPPCRRPRSSEDEEDGQSNDARSDSDQGRADNIDNVVDADIITDGCIAEVVLSNIESVFASCPLYQVSNPMSRGKPPRRLRNVEEPPTQEHKGAAGKTNHATNCSSCKSTTRRYAPPRYLIAGTNCYKGCEEHHDGDEERQCCEAARICDLQPGVPIGKIDGSVADVMLEIVRSELVVDYGQKHLPCTRWRYHPW